MIVALLTLQLSACDSSGTIDGQAFTTHEARVIPAAGERVYLVPVSDTTALRRHRIFRDKFSPPRGDTIPSTWHVTTADAEGRFSFTDVQPNQYLVLSKVAYDQVYIYSMVMPLNAEADLTSSKRLKNLIVQ